ncbi:amino acid permease [Trebonia kvetii]|uniref:Amino acid permease n=1 Tax=Trebonia kvetii TaxID=2480626 RepID=A0A6P2BN94_9ACTN|nr:amino acid permease [Trebonia kvetii]TVZ00097.1 amino acid permease [Trebonia kvetii]
MRNHLPAPHGTGLANGLPDELSTDVLPGGGLPETFGFKLKRKLLGPPLVNEQMSEQRLSRPLALGVLSCDGISSAAYGTEEILIELVPIVGLAAFTLILPMTLLVLAGIALVVLSYREVVSVYTRAGGSYVVARENFGPRVAQVAAVALLIDYVVTVAVQVAAGSAAIVSAFPQLGNIPVIGSNILTVTSVIAVLIMCYGNLRGIREAGRSFALPTYLFSGSVALMIIAGLFRELFGGGLPHVGAYPGPAFPIGHSTQGLLSFGMIYMLARAFANGGSSLTGIEAVSNAVGALRPPEGRNARQILVTQGSIVAFLIAGISWLAHITHAIPYLAGYPTVLAQEANVVFGSGAHFMYFVVQAATALILFTGGNTSFSGFPYLASFVAGDSFLPRWLTKRGHRLALSNGIIVLTVVSLALLIAVGANVNGLIPFYAIGVFTGFTMAGFGMAKYHKRVKERGWRRRRIINVTAAVYTAIVVAIFAIVKFTEGAWLIVIVFPVLVFLLIRLNREYRMESEVLENIGGRRAAGIPPRQPNYSRRVVLIFVDDVDLATFAAIRYARGLRPTTLRAVHFVIDGDRAQQLHEKWIRFGQDIPLEMIDTPDRRLTRASLELVSREAAAKSTQVTVVLPRRGYSPLLGRLLHDRTADKMAEVISQVPDAAATIIPFDVEGRVHLLHARHAASLAAQAGESEPAATVRAKDGQQAAAAGTVTLNGSGGPPAERAPGVSAIGELSTARKVTVEGKVSAISIHPVENSCVFEAAVTDHTGVLTAKFYGRTSIPGFEPGVRVRLAGKVSVRETGSFMINPAYELLARGEQGE